MADLPDLEVKLRLITKEFDARINNVEKSLGGLSSKATATGSVFKGVFGAQLVTTLGRGIFDFIKAGAQDLAEVDRLAKQTESAIKATGGVAGVSAAQVGKLSDSIEKLTGKSAESVTEAQNLLLTFTNISAKDGIFERATKATLDLSTAFGQDASASAIQLGKALNDPIAGISALSRVGVTFTEDQKKVIEALVKSGDVAGAQKVILAELERQVGGSAEAYGTSLAGKVDKARNQIDNFREDLAAKVLPFIADTAIPKIIEFANAFGIGDQGVAPKVGEARSTIQKLVDYFQANIGTIDDFGRGVDRIAAFFRGVETAANKASDAIDRVIRLSPFTNDGGKSSAISRGLASLPRDFEKDKAGGGNFRALGGPVSAGRPYVVGERGPELIVPRSAGTVIPNSDLGGVVININGSVSSETLPTLERRLVGALRAGRRP